MKEAVLASVLASVPADYKPVPIPTPGGRHKFVILAKEMGCNRAHAKDAFGKMTPAEQQRIIDLEKAETAAHKAKVAEWQKGNNGWDHAIALSNKKAKGTKRAKKNTGLDMTPEEEAEVQAVLVEKRKEKEYKVHKAFCDAYEAAHANGHTAHPQKKRKAPTPEPEEESSSEDEEEEEEEEESDE